MQEFLCGKYAMQWFPTISKVLFHDLPASTGIVFVFWPLVASLALSVSLCSSCCNSWHSPWPTLNKASGQVKRGVAAIFFALNHGLLCLALISWKLVLGIPWLGFVLRWQLESKLPPPSLPLPHLIAIAALPLLDLQTGLGRLLLPMAPSYIGPSGIC